MRTVFRVLGPALLALATCSPVFAATAKERTTRALLESLDERQMPDVMLWVIERAEADPAISDAFKVELPFRRATALVGVSRTEGDAAKRAAILDDAEKSLDDFLAKSPTGDLAIAAYSQKGNLLIERGRGAIEQAKRPGQDATKLTAEAIAFFDAAIKSLKGTIAPDQKEIPTVTNAEDAVIKALREVDAQIAEVKSAGKPRAEGATRLTTAQQKQVEQFEEVQAKYRAQLLSTRILVGAAIYEKSKAYPAGSKEAARALDESTATFKAIAEKYGGTAAGSFARFYWGRNLALAGKHDLAADTLGPVIALDGKSPLAMSLKAKAVGTSLECWLAMAAAEKDAGKARRVLERFDDGLRRFVLTPADKLPGRKLDAEWLALKYRGATALDALAGRLDPKEKQARGLLQRDAKKLATEVAGANKDFAKEARELAAKLGKDLPAGADDEKDVAALLAEAQVSFAAFQEKQAEAKQLAAAGKGEDAATLLAGAAPDRNAAIGLLERAIKAGESNASTDASAINAARARLAYLYYDAKRYADAAAVGGLLLERFPNAAGSKQAARVALASLQHLTQQPDPAAAAQARERMVAVATAMTKTWAADPEGAEAAGVLLGVAMERHDAATILALLDAFPKGSPRRADFALRAGTGLRREVQEARRLDPAARPDEATQERWNAAARAAIDEGLASLEGAAALPAGAAAKTVLSAALARVQMALEDGDRTTATRILEHAVYGPWTAVTGDAAAWQGPIAEGTLTVALRHFIETEQIDKAQQAMTALEKAAGTGAEASAKLTAMYLAMGRDLQSQLEALGSGPKAGSPEVRERAAKILAGFEKFLDGVAKRDAKTSSQLWVATTYLTLGSGKETGAVVSKSKAEHYLDRSAETYGRLLARKDDPQAAEETRAELARFEPSIRLKLASIYKERGKWDEAQQQLDWILADPARQNSLEIQTQAAELLETAGKAAAAAGDSAKADQFLREAAGGRNSPPVVIWGWGGIANKLSRQAFAAADEKALKARDRFFDARFHVSETLLARARLGGTPSDRAKRLDTAKSAVAMTRKLFPDLGGDASSKRFEKLLKEIQKEQGAATPGGFAQLDAETTAIGGAPPAP